MMMMQTGNRFPLRRGLIGMDKKFGKSIKINGDLGWSLFGGSDDDDDIWMQVESDSDSTTSGDDDDNTSSSSSCNIL